MGKSDSSSRGFRFINDLSLYLVFQQEIDVTVSIIVPVYNTEKYLHQCIDSILAQTYTDLEIILVDDGSPDNSGEICDEYAAKDARVRVFHIENGGVSNARNYGLDRISGECVMFVDSDDLVKPDYCRIMVDAMQKTDARIVTCLHMSGKTHSVEEFDWLKTKDVPYQTISLDTYRYTNKYAHSIIWGGLYRADLIGNLRFTQDLFVGEDTLFFAQLLKKARQLTFVEEELYYYRYLDTSLAHAQYNARQSTEITAWERVCDVFADESDDFRNECYAALALRCAKKYCRAVGTGFANKELIRSFYRKSFNYKKITSDLVSSRCWRRLNLPLS